MKNLVLPALSVLVLLASPLMADSVTSLPDGVVVPMPALDYTDSFGPGPQTFGSGITWFSTNSINNGGAVFGYTFGYGFGDNGYWDSGAGPMAGLNDSTNDFGATDSMIFALPTPVAGIGGFLNYVPGTSNPAMISVFDSSFSLLESAALTFTTDGSLNSGAFNGFLENTPDISYFALTDNYIGITDLTVQSEAESLPESSGLLATALALTALAAVRRRQAV